MRKESQAHFSGNRELPRQGTCLLQPAALFLRPSLSEHFLAWKGKCSSRPCWACLEQSRRPSNNLQQSALQISQAEPHSARSAKKTEDSFTHRQPTAMRKKCGSPFWHSSDCPFATRVLLKATLRIIVNARQPHTLFLKDNKESMVWFSLSSTALQGWSWARCLTGPALQDITWSGTKLEMCKQWALLPKGRCQGPNWE